MKVSRKGRTSNHSATPTVGGFGGTKISYFILGEFARARARAGRERQSMRMPLIALRNFFGDFGRSATSPNHQVEATAPRRFRFARHGFYNIIVPGERALPGAVPHLGRSVKS
jgi:hypothetical protein